MILLSTLLLSLFITITLIPVSRKVAIRLHGMDTPNERKVHPYPMPKSGGIAMAMGVVISVLVWAHGDHLVRAVLLGTGIVVLFGVIDDFRDLGYKAKFAGQFAAALIVIFYGGIKIKSLGMLLPDDMLLADWVAVPLTLLVIVGVTNAPDFILAVNNLAFLVAEQGGSDKEMDEALKMAQKAVDRFPDEPNIVDTLGWIYYRRGEYEKAYGQFQKLLEKEVDNPVLNYHLGMVLYKQGRRVEAREYLEKALKRPARYVDREKIEEVLRELG